MPFTYAALDFETANPSRASVCQVGVATWVDGEHTGTYSVLVKPPTGHDEFAYYNTKVHGITAARVAHAEPWEVVAPKMMNVLSGVPVFAHNAAFERTVLAEACAATGMAPLPVDLLCSLTMARKVVPTVKKHGLAPMCERYGIDLSRHHDAGADAYASGMLVQELAHEAGASSLTSFLCDVFPDRRGRRGI